MTDLASLGSVRHLSGWLEYNVALYAVNSQKYVDRIPHPLAIAHHGSHLRSTIHGFSVPEAWNRFMSLTGQDRPSAFIMAMTLACHNSAVSMAIM